MKYPGYGSPLKSITDPKQCWFAGYLHPAAEEAAGRPPAEQGGGGRWLRQGGRGQKNHIF